MKNKLLTVIIAIVVSLVLYFTIRGNDEEVVTEPVVIEEVTIETTPEVVPETVPEVVPEEIIPEIPEETAPEETLDTSEFDKVFNNYRTIHGAGYIFEWNGSKYTTYYKEEL